MEFFPVDDQGQSYLQYPSADSTPISTTFYPTSDNLVSHTFTPTNFGYVAQTFTPSGYLVSHRKTTDARLGEGLKYALHYNGIDIRGPPPFIPVTSKTSFSNHGVIKLSNIPFTVTSAEIKQFLGRNAQSVPPLEDHRQGFAIHIIMEKPTGKTMDCFVEFPSQSAAHQCASRFPQNKGIRLGSRNVHVSMSSQAELMRAIFPRARLVSFDNNTGRPTILQPNGNRDWSQGFRGFVTIEEIHGVVRFAESPSRSPFVLKAHQRVYECMISTLYKFPWAATDLYTIAARDALFVAAYNQISILADRVSSTMSPMKDYTHSVFGSSQSSSSDDCSPSGEREVGLNHKLLRDLIFAAVNVPIFSVLQKTALCRVAGAHGSGVPLGCFSEAWPFQTLEHVQGTDENVIRFWLEIFDTGFHIMDQGGMQTGFEEYIIFTRTDDGFGFPIAEWTAAGLELTIDMAVKAEIAAVRQYIDCGLQTWTRERHVRFEPVPTHTLTNVFDHAQYRTVFSMAGSLDPQATAPGSQPATNSSAFAGRHHGKTQSHRTSDEDISPKSSRDLGGCPLSQAPSLTTHDDGSEASLQSSGGRYKFNAATAIDFVPNSGPNQASSTSQYIRGGPKKLTLDTKFTLPAAVAAVTIKKPEHDPISEGQTKYQTPYRPQGLSFSAVDPSPLSNPFSTPSSQGSGVKLPSVRSHPRSLTYSSGTPENVMSSFNNFSFNPSTSNTRAHISTVARSQTQPDIVVRNSLSESPDMLIPEDDVLPSDVLRSSVMRSLEQESKSQSDMGALGQAQSPSGPDFGPVGSARPSISEGSQTSTAAVPAPIMPVTSTHFHRSQSISHEHRTRSSSGRTRGGGNDGRLSATELWSSIVPNTERPR